MNKPFIEFKVYEKYQEQSAQRDEIVAGYFEREQQAFEHRSNLERQYQDAIRASVNGDADAEANLDELDKQIAEAERDITRRQAEHAIARTAKPADGNYTMRDVITAHPAYAETVRKAEVEPFLAKMAEARQLIEDAVRQYSAAKRMYDPYFAEHSEISKRAHETRQTPARMMLVNPFDGASLRAELLKVEQSFNGGVQ